MIPNIDQSGRIARAITGALTGLAGVAAWLFAWPAAPGYRWPIIVVLIAAGAFQIYEAKKSWCVARACGLRTPM